MPSGGRALFLTLLSVAAGGFFGCPGRVPESEELLVPCQGSEQCPRGHICSAGECVVGVCDPTLEVACDAGSDDPSCCDPWESCSPLSFTCEPDPDAVCDVSDPTCTQCEAQADCEAGQLCSAGGCFDIDGRATCTSSFQCPDGEHCDRGSFVCVPRRQCLLCGPDFPQLCCDEEEICSEVSGLCIFVEDPECMDDTECSAGLFCDGLGRCAQCDATNDCGPGLSCDPNEGECIVNDGCVTDDDCSGNERCAPSTLSCVLPECESASDCTGDPRVVCNVGSYRCELPPPVCVDDVDEENDTPALASPLVGGASFNGSLCRDDTDVLSFPVTANRRYTATVDFGGTGQPGIIVTMLADDLILLSTASFAAAQASIQVAGVTGPTQSGTFFLKIQGNNDARDFWTYSVTIAVVDG